MGSRFTASLKEMFETLQVVKDRGLFFVDSLTTGDSKGYKTAKTLHLPATSRDVFLDNRVEESSILRQLHQLKGIASRHGHAVGIGHPFAETSRAIRQFLKGSRKRSLNWSTCLMCYRPPDHEARAAFAHPISFFPLSY